MRLFVRSLVVFILIVLSVSAALIQNGKTAFPDDPGPALDNRVRTNFLKYLEGNRPQLVLLGDSTLGAAVDADQLAKQTDKSVYSISIPGSASALWYLILKSNIAESSYKPRYVLVIFRDTILTAPGYRVHGSYFDLVDEYADHNEPLLVQNSFVGLMNPLEIAAEKYFPLYTARAEIRRDIDGHIRYFMPSVFGCNQDCTDQSLGEVFLAANLEPKALVDAIGASESYLYESDQLDFDAQVGRSYLPEMIRIARENNIKLVFVRMMSKTHPADPKLDAYVTALTDFLHQNDVILLDYGNDPRLTPDFFFDSIHINALGRAAFTPMLAEDLNRLFADQ